MPSATVGLGLRLALVSGVLIFAATPRLYVGNWPFQLKLAVFAVAVLYQLARFRRVATSCLRRPFTVRFSVAATLVRLVRRGLRRPDDRLHLKQEIADADSNDSTACADGAVVGFATTAAFASIGAVAQCKLQALVPGSGSGSPRRTPSPSLSTA